MFRVDPSRSRYPDCNAQEPLPKAVDPCDCSRCRAASRPMNEQGPPEAALAWCLGTSAETTAGWDKARALPSGPARARSRAFRSRLPRDHGGSPASDSEARGRPARWFGTCLRRARTSPARRGDRRRLPRSRPGCAHRTEPTASRPDGLRRSPAARCGTGHRALASGCGGIRDRRPRGRTAPRGPRAGAIRVCRCR